MELQLDRPSHQPHVDVASFDGMPYRGTKMPGRVRCRWAELVREENVGYGGGIEKKEERCGCLGGLLSLLLPLSYTYSLLFLKETGRNTGKV